MIPCRSRFEGCSVLGIASAASGLQTGNEMPRLQMSDGCFCAEYTIWLGLQVMPARLLFVIAALPCGDSFDAQCCKNEMQNMCKTHTTSSPTAQKSTSH